MKRSFSVVFLISAIWLSLGGPLAAQLAPLGPEAQLPANGGAERPDLAVQPGGGYAVAWDDLSNRVFSHYVAAGDEAPGEETVFVGDGGLPLTDSVTAAPRGFEVLWHVTNEDGDPVAFYRRHLDPQGRPAPGRPVLMARGGVDWVWDLGGGRYLSGWFMDRKQSIGARFLSPSGRPAGPVFRLSSRPVDDPEAVAVPLADGGFVAVWLGTRLDKEGKEEEEGGTAVLRARRFSAAGQPLGPDFDVNTTPPGPGETAPFLNPQFQVAAAPNGGFAVSWALDQTIYVRYFDAAGRAVTPEVAAVSDPSVFAPVSMAFDDRGDLLLLWLGYQENSELQIQQLDPHGAPVGPSQTVRSDASDEFQAPLEGSVAWTGDSWLVTWVAADPAGGSRGVFVRRFARE
ncbi:MAG TPA: hypothetical protein VFR03_08685 [Thermoanaerobaculia bacterium]|nr:hypothetical protein [Thermoanaerobaculia bacterium]